MGPVYDTASATFEHPEIYLGNGMINLTHIVVFTSKSIIVFTADLKSQTTIDRTKILRQFSELVCVAPALPSAGKPRFLISAWMDPWSTYSSSNYGETVIQKDALQFFTEIQKVRPEAVVRVGNSGGYFNSWTTPIIVNTEEMTVEHDDTLRESIYVSGSKVDSACEYAPGSLVLALQAQSAFLIAKDW